jgi:hypothetical protein
MRRRQYHPRPIQRQGERVRLVAWTAASLLRAHSGTVEWQFEKFIEFQNKNRQPQKPPI